jgi:hypothetical protein
MTEMKPKDQMNEYGEYSSKEKELKQELDSVFGNYRPFITLGIYTGDRPDNDPRKGKGYGKVSFTSREELPNEDWSKALKWVESKGFTITSEDNTYEEEPGERRYHPSINFEFNVADFLTGVDEAILNEWTKRQWQRRAGIIK